MASRDKVGCPTAMLPLDRLLASIAANLEQLGKRWEIAVRDRRAKETMRMEGRKAEMAPAVELQTPLFYATCALGRVLSTGLTHLVVTPVDLVKCNMQVSPNKYRDISSSFGVLLQEQGLGGFFKGWMATLVGYSTSQGACKFWFYEYFKKCYSDIVGPENADRLKTVIYLAASASAEVIADIALCPHGSREGLDPDTAGVCSRMNAHICSRMNLKSVLKKMASKHNVEMKGRVGKDVAFIVVIVGVRGICMRGFVFGIRNTKCVWYFWKHCKLVI